MGEKSHCNANEIAAEQVRSQGSHGDRGEKRIEQNAQPPAQPCAERRAYTDRKKTVELHPSSSQKLNPYGNVTSGKHHEGSKIISA